MVGSDGGNSGESPEWRVWSPYGDQMLTLFATELNQGRENCLIKSALNSHASQLCFFLPAGHTTFSQNLFNTSSSFVLLIILGTEVSRVDKTETIVCLRELVYQSGETDTKKEIDDVYTYVRSNISKEEKERK